MSDQTKLDEIAESLDVTLAAIHYANVGMKDGATISDLNIAAIKSACLEYAAAMKPCYCLGQNTVKRVANEGQLETEQVNFIAASDLYQKNPYNLIAELQKDKERLDWLATHTKTIIVDVDLQGQWFVTKSGTGILTSKQPTIRSAIDNAMKGETK